MLVRTLKGTDFSGLGISALGLVCLLLIPVFYAPDQVISVGGDPDRQITTGGLALCCGALIVGGFGYQVYSVAKVLSKRVTIAPPDVDHLIETLRVASLDTTRTSAAIELGRRGDRRAVPALVTALSDRSERTRQEAAYALIRLGWTPEQSASGAAFWAAQGDWAKCVATGALAVEPLILVLSDCSKDHRGVIAAKALGDIGDRRAIPALRAAAKTGDAPVRDAAKDAIGKIEALG